MILHARSPGDSGPGVRSCLSWRGSRPGTLARRLLAAGALLALAAFLPGIGPATAASPGPPDLTELPLEELMKIEVASVTTASAHVQTVSEAPASVSVVTSEDIRRYGYRTLAEVLRSVRGFYTAYDRNYTGLGVRGFARPGDYNNRVLVLVDGHRVNDPVYGGAPMGTDFPVDVDLIRRVEIVRGPGSSLYGSNAFFAVINVITRTAPDVGRLEASGEAGTWDTYKARLTGSLRTDRGLQALASGSYLDSAGNHRLFYKEFDRPETHDGVAVDADGDTGYQALANASYGGLSLQGVYGYRKKHVPTGAYGTLFGDSGTYTTDVWSWLDLKYERTLPQDIDLLARLFYDHYEYYGDYVYGDPFNLPETRVVNRDVGRADWWGAELRLSKPLLGRHRLTVGAEYRDNFRQDQENYDRVDPRVVHVDVSRSSRVASLYAQQEVVARDDLRFNVGLRYDNYDTFGDSVNPRAAVIYSPLKTTTFKLVYGEAFRPPNDYELYYADASTQRGNPGLQPETVRTGELIYEQFLGPSVFLVASAFYSRVDDLINPERDESGFIVYQNTGAAIARGLELEVDARLPWGVEARASYTLQRVTDDRTDRRLSNSPTHQAKLNVFAPLVPKVLNGGLEVQYTGQRDSLSGQTLDDFVLVNLTLSSQAYKGFTLSASVYNLLDTKYSDPGGEEHAQDAIRQDGRSFRVKLTYRF